jgi:beta-lactamase superfamily II metal-dependent hydrolase
MTVFRLAMHPASEGDALILSWGEAGALRHALVDLGRTGDYRALKPELKRIGAFELFTVSHVDADHIEGAVPLFKETALPFTAAHVWFNAHAQLRAAKARMTPGGRLPRGAKQGEKMTQGILKSGWPWNSQFASGIVSVNSPEGAEPIQLAGGLRIHLLSPSDRALAELESVWIDELKKAGLRPADPDAVEAALAAGQARRGRGAPNVDKLAAEVFKEDNAEPNGSSITFIAEYGGKRVLLGADSQPGIVEASLRRLGASETNRYKLDCLKVSHHGSKKNTSPALLKIIDCTCFAFSTDGTKHGHPDKQMIARILKNDPARPKHLIFNFRQPSTTIWANATLQRKWNYTCVFPGEGKEGIEFDI